MRFPEQQTILPAQKIFRMRSIAHCRASKLLQPIHKSCKQFRQQVASTSPVVFTVVVAGRLKSLLGNSNKSLL